MILTASLIACSPADPQHDGATNNTRAIDLLPPLSQDPKHPWVPYAAEKAMGAQWCPDPDKNTDNQNRKRARTPVRAGKTSLMDNACLGILPNELAKVLLAIPEKEIFITVEARAAALREPQGFQAIPGHGARPDVLAHLDVSGGIHIRSFEGRKPRDTVYLVEGPFNCIDHLLWEIRLGDYEPKHPACHDANVGVRLYKWTAWGALRDVTEDFLATPKLTVAERSAIEPDTSNLQTGVLDRVPVMRWRSLIRNRMHGSENNDYEPIDLPAGIAASKLIEEQASLHFGYVIWDGHRFQAYPRVPRALWPSSGCDRIRPDWRCDDGTEPSHWDSDSSIEEDAIQTGTGT